jgi:hypothetical protein
LRDQRLVRVISNCNAQRHNQPDGFALIYALRHSLDIGREFFCGRLYSQLSVM